MSLGVYVCNHVFRQDRRVRLIVHHSDLTWQLTCGEYDHDTPELHYVHSDHLQSTQPELSELLRSLRPGFLAEEAAGVWTECAHDD